MAESSRYGSVERAAAPSASRPRRVGLAVLGAASVFLLAAATRRAGAAPLASMLPVQPAEEDDGAVGLLRFEALRTHRGLRVVGPTQRLHGEVRPPGKSGRRHKGGSVGRRRK